MCIFFISISRISLLSKNRLKISRWTGQSYV
jgi:hypothetical protein